MMRFRPPWSIYQTQGEIQNGTFRGRWHFAFDRYYDPNYLRFGALRVFNDDTLSPGAVWPLHPHQDNEVVTYCVEGEFRHADERGPGGILKRGWAQHTTVGKGMWHSEINNLPDKPMRFVQMWFTPVKKGLKPSVEQKKVDASERTNRLLPLVSNKHKGALRIKSDAMVLSCLLKAGGDIAYELGDGRGVYLYVLEGGPLNVSPHEVPALGALMVVDEGGFRVTADADAELLLVDVSVR